MDLIGEPPSAHVLAQYLSTLSTDAIPAPDIKSYPDIVYFSYLTLGVSFQFSPRNGYKPAVGLRREQLKDDDLQLEAVDIYNAPSVNGPAFSTYPRLPIELHLAGATPAVITIAKDATGKEFVGWLGEPSRKGGGAGPSSGSIHIWCEWSQQGLMVEFGGIDARGPQAWERGGDAVWRVVTVFEPKSTS
ncbi:hypothetical protein J3R83DRAFT_6445 [Lanmaoa asiatica]|nr:hypothetical protein J3R83DRAFT_6445 [Lanmaoa asiatica]